MSTTPDPKSKRLNDDEIWLVKSGERVLGPFSTDNVILRVRRKEIVVIDEVISPLGRWRYLRDEPTFQAVVDEVRISAMSDREATEVQGYTQTQTHNAANTVTGADLTGLGDAGEIHVRRVAANETPQMRDADYIESKSATTEQNVFNAAEATSKARNAKAGEQVRSYGIGDERKSRTSKLAYAVWAAVVIVLAGTTYLVLSTNGKKAENGRIVEFGQLVSHGERAWKVGEFEIALKNYRLAESIRPGAPEIVVRLAPLLLQIEGQNVQAKRLLQDARVALLRSSDNFMRSQSEIGLGLAGLFGDDLLDAEGRFRSALLLAPGSYAATFNLGVVSFLAKKYDEAARRFTNAGEEPAALAMRARSWLLDSKASKVVSRREASAAISRLINRHHDFRQEATLLDAYTELLGGGKRNAAALVRSALDLDPDQTSDHWHDPLLYLKQLEWRSLVSVCKELHTGLASPASRTLLALCLAKAGARDESLRLIDEGLATAPDEQLYHAANAYLLAASGRDEAARAALRFALQGDAPVLAQLVQARLCERVGDLGCAESIWSRLAAVNESSLAALTGLARIRVQQGDKAHATELLKKALARSSRYIPALKLYEELPSL